jgi:hypothetical protein
MSEDNHENLSIQPLNKTGNRMRKPPKAIHSNALFIRNKYIKLNNNDFYIAAYSVKHRPGFRRCHLFHINLGTVGQIY